MVASTGGASLDGRPADARPFLLRLGLAFGLYRVAAVGGALLLGGTLRMTGEARVVGTGLVVAAVVAGVLAAREARKRAHWHREPGDGVPIPASVAGALVDAGLVIALAWQLPLGVGTSGVFPGAAVAKTAALVLTGVSVALVVRSRRPHALVGETITWLCTVVRVAAAGGAWVLADRVVPPTWRVQQAVEILVVAAVLAVLVTVTAVMVRRLVQGRDDD
ncbi:hypothetical protein DNL40_07055 [Xylanimonas oleitrophica]|uniref:Uncharacterized protein n=1 Tax=Xylanimonas oleitrophica TaxID=2607479 RepID=A0A2W5WRA4_9MICO|nr:hypothetical protein [Xylanimonas oleitrophica]PZR53857.1 hypothetical protein DNL40_07055 [Xylanimonas oleitrophica]